MLASCFISYFSLFGDWRTYIFGVRNQNIWDPGSAYLASGISFFDQRYSWIGHPGLFLMLLIQSIARLYYWCSSFCFGTSASYYSFLAKNLFGLIFITKLVSTIIHLLSFYALYSLALRLFRNNWLAINSVIAYSTTYVVLFYINYIVPEPLLLLFTSLSISCAWKYYENWEQENKARGYQYVALSAFFAVAALFTKIMIIAPVIVFIPICLILQKMSLNSRVIISLRERIVSAGIFVGTTIPLMVLCGYKVNWDKFIRFWFRYAPGSLSFDSSKGAVWNVVANSREFFEKLIMAALDNLLSIHVLVFGHSKMTLFIMAEMIFFACSFLGLIRYYVKYRDKRMYLLWLILPVVIISPVALYRWKPHYFIIHLAVGSMFFSYFINSVVKRKVGSKVNKMFLTSILTLIIHLFSIATFVDAKMFDIVEYQKNWKACYEALGTIDDDGRIGVLGGVSPNLVAGRMFGYFSKKSRTFQHEFSKFFVPIKSTYTAAELRKQNIQVILDYSSHGLRLRKIAK